MCVFRSIWERDSALVYVQGGSNAIYWASRHGHVDTLKFLNENKCPLDVKDKVRPLLFLWKVIKDCIWVSACHLHHDQKNKDSGPKSSYRKFNLEVSFCWWLGLTLKPDFSWNMPVVVILCEQWTVFPVTWKLKSSARRTTRKWPESWSSSHLAMCMSLYYPLPLWHDWLCWLWPLVLEGVRRQCN